MSKRLQYILATCVIILAIAVVAIRLRDAASDAGVSETPLSAHIADEPLILFTSTAKATSKRLTTSRLDGSDVRTYAPRCERVAASGNYVVCLNRSGNLFQPFQATLMTLDLDVVKSVPIEGVPSRTRVSPDGRYFATTSFVTGDSYAAEFFSTRTVIFDMDKGSRTGLNLETFDLIINGEHFRFTDTNIWGVTFVAGQDRFFATASFNNHRYLVDGNIKERTMLVLRDNVECPSLSPDGLKLAYKKRIAEGQYPKWRFNVLDLTTNTETQLAETRSIDDQIAWLDNDTVLYGAASEAGTDIWKASIPNGEPQLLISGAASPTTIGAP